MATQKFTEISKPEYHNKPISVRCVVAGKSDAPYRIPKTVSVKIRLKGGGIGRPTRHVITAKNETILMLLDIKASAMPSALRMALGISAKNFDYEIEDVQYVDRIFFHQITGEDKSKESHTRMGYMIGQNLEPNRRYLLSGYSTIDPNNQSVTYVFTKAKKLQSDIEAFSIRHEWSNLEEFRVPKLDVGTAMAFLCKVYDSYAHNVTKICDRWDLHMAVDLAFHSSLEFYFGNEYVKKGWIDCMLLGDTRCGKGYVAERMVEYFGVGEVVSAENSSYAGIVAGLEQYQKHWTIKWGKLPMNDGGLLVIDEAGNLREDWGRLSRIRSEGVAEITKIHSHVANARTRLIFIANPDRKMISNYSYGIQAIEELVNAPEDIARFDYILVVAHNEVSSSKINQTRHSVPEIFSQHDERDLIMWAWSRTADQICFTDTALDLTYHYAIVMGRFYDVRIPLVQGENIRIKLARIAIAFAARFYNAKEDGTVLEVSSVFVECAYSFLKIIYGKPSCGYDDFSLTKRTVKESKRDMETLDKFFHQWKQRAGILDCLLKYNVFNADDLMAYMSFTEKHFATDIISALLRNNAIERKGYGYVKLPFFTRWLKNEVLKNGRAGISESISKSKMEDRE